MNRHTTNKLISSILAALVIFDVVLATIGFFFPELWFRVFHGVPYDDPQGFLRRCAANWTAFALIQFLATLRWKRDPVWLAMVSATRLTDIFTDLAYFIFASDLTPFGSLALPGAGPANLLLSWYFFRAYRRFTQSA